MTPKSVCKGFMTPDMMCITDLDGQKLAGDRDPSSEMQMHLEVYRQRPDAQAVVHAHPPIATGFAVAGIPLDRAVLAEVVTTLGSVPIAEYATPSTKELPEAVRKYVKAHDGMLLANHGALTLGKDLFAAYYKMETIEHFAKISLVARMLGGERLLSRAGGRSAAGAARDHYGIAAPGADLPGAVQRRSGASARSSRRRSCPASGSCRTARWPACGPAAPDRSGRGNSANIPRTHGTDRGCGQEPDVMTHPAPGCQLQLPAGGARRRGTAAGRLAAEAGSWKLHGGTEWVRRSAWSRPRVWSR